MEHDFFKYASQIIARDNEAGRCDAAHNREMSLRCLAAFLGKEQLPFSELTPELMVQFEAWLLTNGRKASTSRLYLNQINAIYNYAVKENLVPKIKLLKGVKTTIPAKQERELLTDTELRRMRYADLSDSRPMSFARDMFFFSIYGRGISFTDLANIKKPTSKVSYSPTPRKPSVSPALPCNGTPPCRK